MKNNGLQLDNGNYGVGVFDFDGNILAPRAMFYFKSRETGETIAVSEQDSRNYFNDKYEYLALIIIKLNYILLEINLCFHE